jgi:hypothetical protein
MNHYEYTLAEHWLSALINNDYTGLSDKECKELDSWLDSLPIFGHWDIVDNSEDFKIDDISGLYGKTHTCKLYYSEAI